MTDDAPAGNPQILLRLPDEIGKWLIKTAKKEKCTVQAVILRVIGAHAGIDVDPPQRGRPSKPQE